MSEKNLNVAYLNTVYCTDGRSLRGFLKTHYYHLRRQDHKIEKFADIDIALNFVKDTKPDVAILAEILGERQREKLKDALDQRGYSFSHHGQGQALAGLEGYETMYDEILIASRKEIQALELDAIRQSSSGQHGHGGGLAAVHLPDLDFDLFAGHLPLRPESFKEQIDILGKGMAASKQAAKMVIGDFNLTPDQLITRHPEFVRGLDFLSTDEPTCSTVFPISSFYSKCLDHAWGRGIIPQYARAILAQSDHRGLSLKLRLK